MAIKYKTKLNPRKKYLQIALNSTLDEAYKIINHLPISDRIIVEAGTPLIKRYGASGIRQIKSWYSQRISGFGLTPLIKTQKKSMPPNLISLIASLIEKQQQKKAKLQKKAEVDPNKAMFKDEPIPYVVADLKMMDRGATEVEIAVSGGADAAVALGHAPIESLDAFIVRCEEYNLDSMIDMMNVEYPLAVLKQLKKQPAVVILHRGVDEEAFNKEKMLPLYEIRRIKGNYDVLIAIAGGDTIREVQRAIFNDADIVVVWKSFYQDTQDTAKLAEQFLAHIK